MLNINAEEILCNRGYAADDLSMHAQDVARATGKNLIDGTMSEYQYLRGRENKVYGMGVVGMRDSDIIIAQDHAEANHFAALYAKQMGFDSDTYGYNLPSSGVPSWFTTIWTNKIIKLLFQSTPFFEMTHEFQQGMFGTSNIKIPTSAFTKNAAMYTDHSGVGAAGININWVDRQTVTLQQVLTYGDLSLARFGMAKIDYLANLREAVASSINLDINQIGFNGFAGLRTFGLLNDPGLNPQVTFPAAASNPASSMWIYKTGLEIIYDVQLLINSIVSIALGRANPETDEFYLGVPPALYGFLLQPASSLVPCSVITYLKETYKGIKIIQVQNYQGTGNPIGSVTPNYIQVVFSKLNNTEVALNAFCSPYQSHGVVRELSSFNEKISYTIAGAIVTLPAGIATGSGV